MLYISYKSATKNNDEQTIIGAAERARNLFSVLDSDGNGVLTLEEFIAGILSYNKNLYNEYIQHSPKSI